MHAKYVNDEQFCTAWRQTMRTKYASDVCYQKRRKCQVRLNMYKKDSMNTVHHAARQCRMCAVQHLKQTDPVLRAVDVDKVCNYRQVQSIDPVAVFTQHIQEGLVYTCVSYHRHLHRQSVVK